MAENETYKTIRSFTFKEGSLFPEPTDLLVEAPLEITIDRGKQVLIMCTPVLVRELVYGFLFTDGIINDSSQVLACHIHPGENGHPDDVIQAHVTLANSPPCAEQDAMKRVSFSSCGVCGKQNYSELNPRISRVRSRVRFSMAMINTCSRRLEEHQKLYWRTGGAHAAMLLDRKAAPVLFSEDMGRHNALDKVIGAALLQHIPMDDKILVSSGRASLEMILKTARAGIPLFVAMSRPTSKAVEAAKVYNVTLVDLAKGSNRIHSHARRIEGF
ncbi:MAG TPA: formate dehydrogenase accessory sulfurtransferase FdhD [Desulfobacteraceae bacterium]|nr:formate dehydrogenase accessory sulfurtransferase FdhD [Desulfobacteraceae bacterium]